MRFWNAPQGLYSIYRFLQCNPFEDRALADEIHGCPIIKSVDVTFLLDNTPGLSNGHQGDIHS